VTDVLSITTGTTSLLSCPHSARVSFFFLPSLRPSSSVPQTTVFFEAGDPCVARNPYLHPSNRGVIDMDEDIPLPLGGRTLSCRTASHRQINRYTNLFTQDSDGLEIDRGRRHEKMRHFRNGARARVFICARALYPRVDLFALAFFARSPNSRLLRRAIWGAAMPQEFQNPARSALLVVN